jgi:AraC-like DNA-binding protein
VECDGPIYQQPVFPDGCVDIVWVGEAAPTVAGPATHHVHVPLPVGVDIVGLRFRPGHAEALLGLPADELLNASARLADIWGAGAVELGDPISEQRSVREKINLLRDLSVRKFANGQESDAMVAACVAWLASHPTGRISELQRVSDMSSRQLQRRFQSAVGYGPKTFQRIVRLQRLLDLSARDAARNAGLAALSDAAGYADQAHMSREVRDLTGRLPSSLLAGGGSTLAMSDLFKTGGGESR